MRRLISLLCAAGVIVGLLYYLIERVTGERDLAAAVLVGSLVGAFMYRMAGGAVQEWTDLFLKDSADGVVDEAGIRYRTILRWHSLAWHNVQRVDHWPQNKNRLDVYLFSRLEPIRFGPTADCANALALIQKKLHELGPRAGITSRGIEPKKPSEFQGMTASQKWKARGVIVIFCAVHEYHHWRVSPHSTVLIALIVAETMMTALIFLATFDIVSL